MAWKSDDSLQCRHASPTECERLLGFPAGWTALRESPETEKTKMERWNAVGIAFAVPVISRLFIALIMPLKIPSSSVFPLWSGMNMTQPYMHDVLDDILPRAQELSIEFQDLTQE